MSETTVADKRAIGLGFTTSILVAAALFAVFTYVTESNGLQSPAYFGVLLLVGTAYSAIICIVLALPVFMVLRLIVFPTVWWALLTGAVIGLAAAIATEWPPGSLNEFLRFDWHVHAVGRALAFAVIGGVSGIGFWWAYKRSSHD